MKKYFWVLLPVFLLLMPTMIAHADVIIEPTDEFYLFNAGECEYLGKSFYADGGASVKKEPGSDDEVAVVESNAEVYVYCTYGYEGETWGLMVEKEDVLQSYGWVLMDELLPVTIANPSTGEPHIAPLPVILLVTFLALGTVILIRLFWKPKKSGA